MHPQSTMTATAPPPPRPSGKRRTFPWKRLVFLLIVVAAAIGTVSVVGVDTARRTIQDGFARLTSPQPEPVDEAPVESTRPDYDSWDGLVHVTSEEQKTIGFQFAPVKAQIEPLKLELNGRTAYDDTTVTKVRPRFDTRVEKVMATLGQTVAEGSPLVELYSIDLANAKSDFQTKFVQWQRDQKLYALRKSLVASGAISQQLWVDTQNNEQESRLAFNLAHDKLDTFYEVPKEEIDPLLKNLGDQTFDVKQFGTITNKARMIMRAKKPGIVIEREVVPGNYYESTDVLMVIAPLDHLWVWVNVYEKDQDKVHLGQAMEIQFPFSDQKIIGRVDYVAPAVSKDTRAVRVRASIPNPDAKLKSEMFVKAVLQIQAMKGYTVIPRLAMVAINGSEYAFVRVPHAKDESEEETRTDRFKRVGIKIALENADDVIVAEGLSPGDEVVTNGSLILSQLYEDQAMVVTGLPAR